jgi:site-specific recombinase XerD
MFTKFCEKRDLPTQPADQTRRHVEAFIADQVATTSSSTAASRFRYLQQWFRWLAEEDIVDESPMAKMHIPKIEEKVVPILDADQLRALIKACSGKSFDHRRDEALVRFMVDTGCRLGEVCGMTIGDVDLRAREAVVSGKGDRQRRVFFSPQTAEAMARYERQRRRHAKAGLTDRYWIGPKGALTDSGITQLLRRRATTTGIEHIHPHMLRHTWAHLMKASGMADDEVMALGGWRTGQMLARYGSSARAERARATYENVAPGGWL